VAKSALSRNDIRNTISADRSISPVDSPDRLGLDTFATCTHPCQPEQGRWQRWSSCASSGPISACALRQDTIASIARGRQALDPSDKPRHVGKRAWHPLSAPVLGTDKMRDGSSPYRSTNVLPHWDTLATRVGCVGRRAQGPRWFTPEPAKSFPIRQVTVDFTGPATHVRFRTPIRTPWAAPN
jgi:hypothetical protein